MNQLLRIEQINLNLAYKLRSTIACAKRESFAEKSQSLLLAVNNSLLIISLTSLLIKIIVTRAQA